MGGGMSELVKRILTGSVLALVTVWLIFQSPTGFAIAVAIVAVIIGVEFTKLSKIPALLSWFIMTLALMPPIFENFLPVLALESYFILLGFVSIAFWLKNLYLVVNYPHKKPCNNTFNQAISLFLLIAPLVFLPLLQGINQDTVLLLLFIVWGADSIAYFSGKTFGKHKLAPKLSGGKTVEGVIGGLLGVLIITGLWMLITHNLDWRFLILGFVTGIFSVIGDLYESIYKREAGVKDSGNILPGHGGMFDRLDGMLAATPIFTSLLILLQYTQ